jgi:hypothetical protein
MTIVRALIRKDRSTGRYVAWVPRLMPAGQCESDDFLAVREEIERTVHRLMEQHEPGSTRGGVRIETASVI